jgi:hypothetical protein
VYRRYEPNPAPEQIDRTALVFTANQAMLGRIHQNVRKIYLIYNESLNKIDILVYFDKNPNPNQINDIEAMVAEMRGRFSEDISWGKRITTLPYPTTITMECDCICVYSQSEPFG